MQEAFQTNPMTPRPTEQDPVSVRLAASEDDIKEAQRVRYRVFYEEQNATPSPAILKSGRDMDDFDAVADHLIVTDRSSGREEIIGTYRLLRREVAYRHGKFYSGTEYDLTSLLSSGSSLLELGRSCVLPEYRTRSVMQLLWQGIADYVSEHNIELLFGCASFNETDIEKLAAPLSYLYHYHLAPPAVRARALEDRYIDMNILPQESLQPKALFNDLPPLIKGYLRVGATVGDGAVFDPEFNTIDVFVVMQTHMITERYRRHYERKIRRPIPGAQKETGKKQAVRADAPGQDGVR